MNSNVEFASSMTQEVLEITIPDSVSYSIKDYIENELKEHNPYTSEESIIVSFAERVFLDLVDHTKTKRFGYEEIGFNYQRCKQRWKCSADVYSKRA